MRIDLHRREADLLTDPIWTMSDRYASGIWDPRARARGAARLALSQGVADVAERTDALLLRLFREFLAATVDRASPLLVAVCAAEGLDLDALALRLRPWGGWPSWLCGGSWGTAVHRGRVARIPRGTPDMSCAAEFRRFTSSALVLRGRRDPAGAFAVRALGGCLEVGVALGPAMLRTEGGMADLRIRHRLPECVRLATVGRDLSSVVDHPLLVGRDFVVAEASEERGGVLRLGFDAPGVPWTVPWAT